MKLVVIFLIVIGSFNELSGMFALIGAKSSIHEIAGICLLMLGTLQYILAAMLWPKKT